MTEQMRCINCWYARPRYDKDGKQIGVECSHDNMRFIDIEFASVMYCGAWAEVDG